MFVFAWNTLKYGLFFNFLPFTAFFCIKYEQTDTLGANKFHFFGQIK